MSSKILPSSYPPISHLPGSKFRETGDSYIGEQEASWLTVKTKRPEDLVIVTEKVDGCNVGVLRRQGSLYPIIRKGYDVRTNQFDWIRDFAKFVEKNRLRFCIFFLRVSGYVGSGWSGLTLLNITCHTNRLYALILFEATTESAI